MSQNALRSSTTFLDVFETIVQNESSPNHLFRIWPSGTFSSLDIIYALSEEATAIQDMTEKLKSKGDIIILLS